MKITFNFLTRNELFNKEIWENYFKQYPELIEFAEIKIWADPGYEPVKDDYFSKFFVNHGIQKDKFKTVGLRLKAIQESIGSDFSIFLSEDTLPIKDYRDLLDHLSKNIDNSFMEFQLDPHVDINDGRVRYGGLRDVPGFPDEYRMKNNDWVCLCKKHTKAISENYQYCEPFVDSHIGSEHFVSSVLNILGLLENVIPDQLVYEDWSGYNGNYPSIFTPNEIEQIREIKQNPNVFFLRKIRDGIFNPLEI